jgi:hypothetical protein
MRIAVLGSGPAGLLAAHACSASGHDVTIFTKNRDPSPITGAQYIHEPIPGLTNDLPDGVVQFHKVGTAEGYANKVYGDPFAPTSWDLFPVGIRKMWSMKAVYDRLFNEWYENMNTVDIDGEWLDYLEDKRDMFALVISAIPCPIICKARNQHEFPSVEVVFEDHDHKDANLGEHYIYYSGSETDPWYRSSHVGGQGWYEYGQKARVDPRSLGRRERNLRKGIKPLNTTCNCRKRMIRVGRFGTWTKGVLVHHAYFKALDALEVTSKPLHIPTRR